MTRGHAAAVAEYCWVEPGAAAAHSCCILGEVTWAREPGQIGPDLAVIIINQLRCTFYAHPPPPRYSVKLLERLLRPALVTALPPHATRPILMIDGYYLTYSHTPATWRIKIRQHKVSNRLLRQRIDGYSDCCCQNSAVHGPGSHRARVAWYSRLCRGTGRFCPQLRQAQA